MNKTLKIINEIYYWKDLLKIPYFVLNVDNKTKYAAYVNKFNQLPALSINLKFLQKQKAIVVYGVILHEFGHLINLDWKYNRKESIAEYKAEKFALSIMKKYCPAQDFKQYIRDIKTMLRNKKWRRTFPVHSKVFKKLYYEY